MIRRVRRKAVHVKERKKARNVNIANWTSYEGFDGELEEEIIYVERNKQEEVKIDWTDLPNDTVVQLFSLLNYRDRASLASLCKTWRIAGSTPSLWTSLDIRAHKLNAKAADSLAGRCSELRRLRFRGVESANAIINLNAKKLRDLSGEFCRDLTDATLSMLAARHDCLESLYLGPDYCERITSDAIRVVAFCCPKLKRLRVSGIRDVDGEAIGALLRFCPNLVELGFLDCVHLDEEALGKANSVKYLSVAGSRHIKWRTASQLWSNMEGLVALDISRTDVTHIEVNSLLSSQSLRVLSALNCPFIEDRVDSLVYNSKTKLLFAKFTDVFKGLNEMDRLNLFPKVYRNGEFSAGTDEKERVMFWNTKNMRSGDRNIMELTEWLEWILSQALLRIAENNAPGLDNFWLRQGTPLLLSLLKSLQEDVQERAATGLATFVVVDDENATVDPTRAAAVMQGGGIRFLLGIARSCCEGVQSEAAKAIANLSVNADVAKAVALEGGIGILAALARSPNRLVAEEAAGGLWNLSVGEEHKGAIAAAGGVKALVDLIFKWASGGDGVLRLQERAAGALANLAADDRCSMEVAQAGGVHALVMLACSCKVDGVQEQAARALANLAAHGDSNGNNAAVGQEAGALEALVQLTFSLHEGVRQEAAGALWNLSFDDRNREAIAAAHGVEALVALAQNCGNASQGLQERAAGALWGLSVSEANSIAIGREGGISPLISLARSLVEDVHETAAGALWNLAFNPGNAWRIVEEGGVPALVNLCSSSASKMARFMAGLALAYMFDGRMEEAAAAGMVFENAPKNTNLDSVRRLALRHIEAFILTFTDHSTFSSAASSWAPAALAQAAEAARIHEAGHLRCSGAEVGRFMTMIRNTSPVLRACAAFALLQFTMPGGRHTTHHANLLQKAGAGRVLRAAAAAAATPPLQAKVFARIVLRNLDLCSAMAKT